MYKLIRPLLFRADPEAIHHRVSALGAQTAGSFMSPLVTRALGYEHEALRTTVWDIPFSNPVGLAAGFDKYAQYIQLATMLGFGFTEIGSISAQPSQGNPQPRLFRLPHDQGIINRMGLNNAGADALIKKLISKTFSLPIGVNIVKTNDPTIIGDAAIQDFVYSFTQLYQYATYITLNISCPNTDDGKTFEDPSALDELLSALKEVERTLTTATSDAIQHPKKPILVKISPDVQPEDLQRIIEVSEKHGIDGYIISNTTMLREKLHTPAAELERIGKGGLSGRPVRHKSTLLICHAYEQLKRPCIVGVGGIFTAYDAYEKIRAGASLVQIYTGMVYEGPAVVKRINKGLVELLHRDGFSSIHEAVGSAHK